GARSRAVRRRVHRRAGGHRRGRGGRRRGARRARPRGGGGRPRGPERARAPSRRGGHRQVSVQPSPARERAAAGASAGAVGAVPDAYAAAKTINAAVMSLAAVPAYFLAHRLLRPALALVAAALTVTVPSMLYTGTLMTENVFYPLFLTVALVLVLMLERPTV